MFAKLLSYIPMVAVLIVSTSACKNLTVQVGKKASASDLQAASSDSTAASMNLYNSWNSMEDNVERLEELKKQGAKIFLERYQSESRSLIRSLFRTFRDAVVRNASTEHNYGLSLLGSLEPGQCKTAKDPQDLCQMEGYGDIRPLLQTAILAKLNADDAPLLNPSLPGSLDSVTKLIFFELGIKLDGTSSFVKTDVNELMKSEINMQVIHERGEPMEWQDADSKNLRFAVDYNQTADLQNLKVAADVGASFMQLSYTKEKTWQNLEVKNGADGALAYSRRIALYPDAPNARKFRLVDTTRFQMEGEKSRTYTIDIERREVCAVATGGKDPGTPTTPTTPTNPGKDPDTKPDQPNQSDNPTQNGK